MAKKTISSVPASSVGAPHRRDRIIIIAYSDGIGCDNRGYHREERHVSNHQKWHVEKSESERHGREYRLGTDGSTAIMAYPDGSGLFHGQAGEQPVKGRESSQLDTRESSTDVAYSHSKGLQGWEEARNPTGSREEREQQPSGQGDGIIGWWSVEPCVGRVASRVPNRTHRIKALGNAVVPQWAQAIGEAIKESNIIEEEDD